MQYATAYNKEYPSITALLNLLRKEGLEKWFKENSAEFCDQKSDRGKEVGRTVHSVIQAQIEQERFSFVTEFPGEVQTALKSFDLFREEHREVKLKKAEVKMISDKYKINAKLDCLAKIQWPVIFDWKVQKAGKYERPKIYEEAIHQAAAYVKIYNSWKRIEDKTEAIKQAAIVTIAKDKIAYDYLLLTENVINDSFFNVTLPLVKIWKYKKQNGYLREGFNYGKKRTGTDGSNKGNQSGGSGQGTPGDTGKNGRPGKKSAGLPRNF